VALDIVTLLLCLSARNEIAVKQFLQYLAAHPSLHADDYAKMVVLKTVALMPDPTAARDWLQELY
jgi:geranylgeranyl pyrophosphate synthase